MGMLAMLNLICYSIYANADAPPVRGFSHIELWMIGMLIPILVAIIEYGVTLCLYRYWELKELEQKVFVKSQITIPDSNKKILTFKIDMTALLISIIYYVIFFITYCLYFTD